MPSTGTQQTNRKKKLTNKMCCKWQAVVNHSSFSVKNHVPKFYFQGAPTPKWGRNVSKPTCWTPSLLTGGWKNGCYWVVAANILRTHFKMLSKFWLQILQIPSPTVYKCNIWEYQISRNFQDCRMLWRLDHGFNQAFLCNSHGLVSPKQRLIPSSLVQQENW